MGKVVLYLLSCVAMLFLSGCSGKQQDLDGKPTVKRTNITVNSYTDCPAFSPTNYKTIPYE